MAGRGVGHYHSHMLDVATHSAPRSPVDGRDGEAFEILPGDAAGGLVLLCDHASNHVPPEYGALGLPPSEFGRHIAYDIGAEALTRGLAARFGIPAALSRFSRLLIDPNRGLDDPTLIMKLSDGAVVPGNARIDAAERERRIARFYRPYDDAVLSLIEAGLATGRVPTILSVHSFTPIWRGTPRPWHAGVLWDADPRFARPLIDGLAADPAMVIGDNEPYLGALKGDTLYRHATRRGIAHALLEVRQDLIADPAGVAEWVERVAKVLVDLDLGTSPHGIEHFGSLTGPVA
ncbi:N-formylglutamate amidohydrolase [Kaistia dalseonensis]|uniref:N-formylglutamate amidohydrolase n=1 Tax=Kaistia dalseonensis TaxID=410840 RepID=A0ABU0HA74_9HYPH|nr:N-formylglutamate amidohydrolase [Kaistia dalseonensis]MCX5496593.1 N-formylglutamate amidohydrolase [Kaistia dalseonensis]MDQ0439216.1 putative N-formylglutamate amidohydrolase [Kaistia dalseonensis]